MLTRLAAEGHPMSREELAQAEGLTKPYVFKIMKVLRSSGLVGSRLGRNGGYFLAKPADTITVADIYQAVDGPVRLAPCGEGCGRGAECPTQGVWQAISAAIEDEMSRHTVAEMAGKLRVDKDEVTNGRKGR